MRRLLLFFLCACVLHLTVSAHVLDDYVQVAQIALSPGGVRVEMRLTPGVEIADRVFALIDADGDGKISPEEEQVYARRVLQDISLEVDGRHAVLALTDVQFPSRREISEGVGAIHLNFAADAALGATGEHQIFFRNNHLPDIGVYLANVLVPTTDSIKITDQQHDKLQHELRVSFRVPSTETRTWMPAWMAVRIPWIVGLFLCLGLALVLGRRQLGAKKTIS